MKIIILNVGGKSIIVNSVSNRKYFDTTLVSITSSSGLVLSGIKQVGNLSEHAPLSPQNPWGELNKSTWRSKFGENLFALKTYFKEKQLFIPHRKTLTNTF